MSPVGQSSRGRKMKAFKDQLKQVSQESQRVSKSLLQATLFLMVQLQKAWRSVDLVENEIRQTERGLTSFFSPE